MRSFYYNTSSVKQSDWMIQWRTSEMD